MYFYNVWKCLISRVATTLKKEIVQQIVYFTIVVIRGSSFSEDALQRPPKTEYVIFIKRLVNASHHDAELDLFTDA